MIHLLRVRGNVTLGKDLGVGGSIVGVDAKTPPFELLSYTGGASKKINRIAGSRGIGNLPQDGSEGAFAAQVLNHRATVPALTPALCEVDIGPLIPS